jgi:hypothetical protein
MSNQSFARFTQVVSGGNLATVGNDKPLGATVELCVAGNFTHPSHYDDIFVYYRDNIGGKLYANDGSATMPELSHASFHTSYHIVVAGNFGGNPKDDLLLYNRATGSVQFLSIDGSNKLQHEHRTQWFPRWDMIIPGIFDGTGYADLLFYNRPTGSREFYTTNGRRPVRRISSSNTWSSGWDIIVPGNFDSTAPFTELMFYDRNQGFVQFYATNGAGRLQTQPIRQQRWGRSWDVIIPGNFGGDGRTDLFCYDRDNDKAQFWAFTGGAFRQVGSTLSMDHKWQHIVPGNFVAGEKTDLLFIR